MVKWGTPERNAQMENETKKEKRQRRKTEAGFIARIGPHALIKENYVSGLKKIPIAGVTAEYEPGATNRRITGTRIITGALLAGPIGAVAGGALRKDTSKCYVMITFPNGDAILVDAPLKDERKAREFAAKVNAASIYYADLG